MTGSIEKDETSWWEKVRKSELDTALEIFPSQNNLHILEIGGRDGYQANIISKKGHSVTSIDINPIYPQFHTVQKGTINQLDFKENSFDIIYSSNMLQELQDIEEAFNEIKRVLKEDGLIIHIVPTTWWSLITNFWHYCKIPKYLIKSNKFKRIFNSNLKKVDIKQNSKPKSSTKNLKQLFLHPLGANASFIHEIIYFSKIYWKKLFEKNGFKVIEQKNCPYFYSAYSVFKFKFLKARTILSKVGITSCYCYVMKKSML